jgi:RNA polymerase sigma factor (sigma-70 family)
MICNLLKCAKDGDSNAEDQLFNHLIVRFKAFTTRKIGGDQADDIVQEACGIILKKYKQEEFDVAFTAWAHGILKNVIRNHLRNKRIKNDIVISVPDPDSSTNSSSEYDHELKITLLNCLKKILKVHPRYARALNLIHLGYKSNEIQRRIAVSPKNLYVILNRGRKMLRRCLDNGRI